MKKVNFKNGSIDISGNIYFPKDFSEKEKYAALVIVTPGSNVKEQIGAFYGERMAERGFVVLAFDPSYQGESAAASRAIWKTRRLVSKTFAAPLIF